MGEHLVLCVDHLFTPESLSLLQGQEVFEFPSEGFSTGTVNPSVSVISNKENKEKGLADEGEPLLESVECRICQEEDSVKNLEIPCACSGTLKYAHRKCVQHWCNEKGDVICEICHQPYQHGYTASPRLHPDDTTVEISEGWTIAGNLVDLRDPRLLPVAGTEHHVLEADYDEYTDSSASGAAFCRSATLILMALLLLRHTLTTRSGDSDNDDDDVFAFFIILLRVMGFLLPCYVVAWAISILQHRRQRQEAAASEVAFMLQAGQHRGLQVTIAPTPAPVEAPEPAMAPRPEPAI